MRIKNVCAQLRRIHVFFDKKTCAQTTMEILFQNKFLNAYYKRHDLQWDSIKLDQQLDRSHCTASEMLVM